LQEQDGLFGEMLTLAGDSRIHIAESEKQKHVGFVDRYSAVVYSIFKEVFLSSSLLRILNP